MAENDPTQDENNDEELTPKGGGLMGKLKIGLFILVVVVVECVAAYAFLGDSSEAREGIAEELKDQESGDAKVDEERVEIPLGDFDVTVFQPTSNTTLRINFKLVASVFDEDKYDVETILKDNQHRFNEMVLVTVRSSEITDLTDPALGLLKRKMLEKSNRLFGKPIIQSVFFSQFSYFEQ